MESNTSGRPFDRDQRSLIYRRAKGIEAVKPFGTELDVYAPGYGFVSHSAKKAICAARVLEMFENGVREHTTIAMK